MSYSFENLTLITGGDPALEVDLLETFLLTSREYIDRLHIANDTNDPEEWKKEAHGLKGGCYNLGADDLGKICEQAQKVAQESTAARGQVLQSIENEFQKLVSFITPMIAELKGQI